MSKNYIKYFLSIVLFGLLIYFFQFIQVKFYSLNLPQLFEIDNIINDENCEIINSNLKQFYVNINGSIYPKKVNLIQNVSIDFKCLSKRSPKIKTIFYWNKFFSREIYKVGSRESFELNNCPMNNCVMTDDMSQFNSSDLILAYPSDDMKMPEYRLPNQRWVFFIYESPYHSNNFHKFDNFYNLTSTYKTDSDFGAGYETEFIYYWKLNETFNKNYDYTKGKTHLAAALISNCYDNSNRLNYINKLKKYIKTDVFGKCGDSSNLDNLSLETIVEKYKFYLAFENSFCEDYITEKFFKVLQFNVVPVVYGFGPYDFYVITFFNFIILV